MSTKVTYVCEECGSTDVYADAYVAWGEEAQEWQIVNMFDKGAYCNVCDDGEVRLIRKELP